MKKAKKTKSDPFKEELKRLFREQQNMKKKRTAKEKIKPTVLQRVERLLGEIASEDMRRLIDTERELSWVRRDLNTVQERLSGMLNADQIEAARICGCPTYVYALECMDLWMGKKFPKGNFIVDTSIKDIMPK
jgi:hypothetical protein